MKIIKFPSNLDHRKLKAEVVKLNFKLDGSGAEMTFDQGSKIPSHINREIKLAIEEIASIRGLTPISLMINKLANPVVVPFHRDFLPPSPKQRKYPVLERWHLPVIINPKCFWEDEVNGIILMKERFWYGPMPYWKMHRVGNNGGYSRFHLIVDLDTDIPIGQYDEQIRGEW